MAKGQRPTSNRGGPVGQRGRDRTPAYGERVAKPVSTSSSGPQPMDVDSKLSTSLDELIKRDKKPAKKPTKKPTKNPSQASRKPIGKNSGRPKKIERAQKVGSRKMLEAPSLQITVNASKIQERPVLNRIISNAQAGPSQKMAPRLRERVQPVPLDYRGRLEDQYYNHQSQPPRYAPNPAISRIPPPAPMSIDHNGYYGSASNHAPNYRMHPRY